MKFRYIAFTVLFLFISFPCFAEICGEARAKLEKGRDLYENEQYSEATSLYLKAMKAAKEKSDMQTYTEGLYDLGMVYVRMDDLERALYYFNQCLNKAQEIGDKTMQGKCAAYITSCYGFMNDLQNAKKYYAMQLSLPHENDNMKLYYQLYNGALIDFIEKKYNKALKQLYLANDCIIRHKLDRKYMKPVYGIMVYIQLYQNNISEALRYCEDYRKYAKDDKRKLWKEAYYEMLYDIYRTTGDTVKSKKYRSLADATFNARIAKQQIKAIDNSIVQFEGKTNRDDIMALNSTVNRQWLMIAMCVTFVVVLSLLVILIVVKNRRLKHAYQLVISKNRELIIASQVSQKLRSKSAAQADATTKEPKPANEKDAETNTPGTDNDLILTQEQIDDILAKVTSVMEDVDTISRSDFTLTTLAQMIGSNTRYVSWVINNTYKKNFKTLLNEYRIREVCHRMEDTENFGNFTIQALSNSLGYSSASNFLRAFKNVNGMTPSTYMKLIAERKAKETEKDAS